MLSLKDLGQLWRDHCACGFPQGCYEERGSVDLVSLDTFTAGCVSTFLDRKGRLDPKRRKVLLACRSDLRRTLDKLDGEERDCFLKLAELAEGVLQFLRAHKADD